MTLISNFNSDFYSRDRPGHSVPKVCAPSKKKKRQVLFKYKIAIYIWKKNLCFPHPFIPNHRLILQCACITPELISIIPFPLIILKACYIFQLSFCLKELFNLRRNEVSICGQLIAVVAESNSSEDLDACLLCCVGIDICDELITRSEQSCRVWCV
jgi:hypothetical protein